MAFLTYYSDIDYSERYTRDIEVPSGNGVFDGKYLYNICFYTCCLTADAILSILDISEDILCILSNTTTFIFSHHN